MGKEGEGERFKAASKSWRLFERHPVPIDSSSE